MKTLNMTNLYMMIDQQGNTFPNQNKKTDLTLIQDVFQGKNKIIQLADQSLLFSIPLKDNKEITKVLIGICDKRNIQDLIQPKSFQGNGLSCIVIKWTSDYFSY